MSEDLGGIGRSLRTRLISAPGERAVGVLISGRNPESPAAPVRLGAIGEPSIGPSAQLLMIAGLAQDRE